MFLWFFGYTIIDLKHNYRFSRKTLNNTCICVRKKDNMKYVIIEELVLAVIVYKLDAILLQLKCTYSQGTMKLHWFYNKICN